MAKPTIEIDGARFNSLDSFWDEISIRILPGTKGVHNFDAFNDILRGGFGTPEGGFRLRWLNSRRSRDSLGYKETIRWLEYKLQHGHPQNVEFVKQEIERARRGEGQTIADIIIEIIQRHGPGGEEEEDGIELELA